MLTKRVRVAVGAGAVAVLLALLVACGGGPTPPTNGSVAGTVVVGTSPLGTALAPRGPASPRAVGVRSPALAWSQAQLSEQDFVAGELIVGFKPVAEVSAATALAMATTLDAAGRSLSRARSIPAIAAGLYRAPGLDHAQTLALIAELEARPDVAYAEPNLIYQPLLSPNDALYGYQWHYDVISMESAWDLTTGSSDVVVAVVDSGILWSASDASKRHPDFVGRLVSGYDFISDPNTAVDGDGRDPDPFDSVTGSVYHGTHVAGTIGAASNNGVGVTGVDWQAKILPVRALGDGGGTLDDILDAVLWAAGNSVAGAPTNANPADVINLSLGGSYQCPASWQATIDFVSLDTIVVAAAGNESVNTAGISPAGCAGLITVGATDFAGSRARYSNFGSRIDVMAPGGALNQDQNSDGQPDGVLSTGYSDFDQEFDYYFLQGTSMAAPHVSGVVALMKALDPTLDTAAALAALRASATPLSSSQCDNGDPARSLTSSDCGAGLIDAAKALEYTDDGEIPVPPGASLAFTPTVLDFGAGIDRVDFELTNVSGTTLTWELSFYQEAGDNPGDMLPGAFTIPAGSPSAGTLTPGASATTAIVIDRDELTADGSYQIELIFEIDGGVDEELLLMRFSKTTTVTPTLSGPMIVAAYIEDEFGQLITSGHQSSDEAIHTFDFEVLPGFNVIAAWSDKNHNGVLDEGDLFGVYSDQQGSSYVYVPEGGGRRSGLVISVTPYTPFSASDAERLLADLERIAGE